MSKPIRCAASLLAALALVQGAAHAQDAADEHTGEFSARGYDVVRIENEYKLSVPPEQTEDVWRWLQERYGKDSPVLAGLGEGFTAKLSDEHFVDRYFDDPGLSLLHAQSGIRHRRRVNLSDASDRKSGRELVQVKLRRPGEQEQNRSEIKFRVKHYDGSQQPLDAHPVIGLVDRDDRNRFAQTVGEYGFDAMQLAPMLTLEQRRRRVYVSKDGQPFSTLTLDEVSSEKWGETIGFTEIEMELNEIAYTEAPPAARDAMQRANDAMKADLLAAFPRIVQDQTPKYNKAYDRFAARFHALPLALRIGMPLDRAALLLGAAIAAALALAALLRRPRKPRRPVRVA